MQNGFYCFIRNAIIVVLMILSFSCVPTRKLSYFNDIDKLKEPIVNPREQKLIMPFDRLYIRVLSIDEQTNAIFNSTDETRNNFATNIIGYPVDEDGNINFPFVGFINVAGFTTARAGTKIQEALSEYISKTSITVKYIDNNISVLGEVQRQGTYNFSRDKLTIYEALALGGGLTRYGNRKKVILIRQEGDRIMHHKLDLSNSRIVNKDYYYVLPNDVIVVEPLKSISSSYENITYTTILTSITTLIAILFFAGLNL